MTLKNKPWYVLRPFKNEKLERYAKVIDMVGSWVWNPQPMNSQIYPKHWKLSPVYPIALMVGLGNACVQSKPPEEQTKAPAQVEQQAASEVPAIKVIDNKLFVDGNEMLAKDFVQKYCFAKRDNQTCVEAIVLNRIQDRHTGGAKPKF